MLLLAALICSLGVNTASAGVAFTLPALFIMGEDFNVWSVIVGLGAAVGWNPGGAPRSKPIPYDLFWGRWPGKLAPPAELMQACWPSLAEPAWPNQPRLTYPGLLAQPGRPMISQTSGQPLATSPPV